MRSPLACAWAERPSLLLTRPDPVLQVALACGFESHAGFTRAFRKRFGLTPSAYRDRGFAGAVDPEQEAAHDRLLREVGPCVGLYQVRKTPTRRSAIMEYEITRKDVERQTVLVGRRKVSQSEIAGAIGDVVPRVFQFALARGLAFTGRPFTRYLDSSPGLMTIEPGMCVALPEEGSDDALEGLDDDLRPDELPGGPVASTVHAGPYETLDRAYAALESWMEAQGVGPAGPPWESYLTDPAEHPDPQDWRTEVCWPIR